MSVTANPPPMKLARTSPETLATHTGPGAQVCRVVLTRYTTKVGRKTAWNGLRMVAATLELEPPDVSWHTITYEAAMVMRAALIDRYPAPSSSNLAISMFRTALGEAYSLGLLDSDGLLRLTRGLRRNTGERLLKGRSLAPSEVRAMVDFCRSRGDARGAAMLAVLSAGLRRAEVAGLTYGQATWDGCLTPIGKGNKQRVVWMPEGGVAALRDWLRTRGKAAPGEPLFCRSYKGKLECSGHMSPAGVYQAVATIVRAAGLTNITPHDFRRTFAGEMLDEGADLATVQKLMGHSSPETTAGYDRRPETAGRLATSKLVFPYKSDE